MRLLLILLSVFLSMLCSAQVTWNEKGNPIDCIESGMNTVAMSSDGNTVAVGQGNDLVVVYKWDGSDWTVKGDTIFAVSGESWFAESIDLNFNGNVLAIGSYGAKNPYNESAGSVAVYKFDGVSWNLRGQKLYGELKDWFGFSLDLNEQGNVLAVGAPYANDPDVSQEGYAQVYYYGTVWTQLGDDIKGDDGGDHFGWSVSLDDSGFRLAVGAEPLYSYNRGYARIFDFNSSGVWEQVGNDIDSSLYPDLRGIDVSMSLDGETIAVGNFHGGNGGRVDVLKFDGSEWVSDNFQLTDNISQHTFGYSIDFAQNANILVVGSPNFYNNDTGYVDVYKWDGMAWTNYGNRIREGIKSDFWGRSVDIDESGKNLIVGSSSNTPYVKVYTTDVILSSEELNKIVDVEIFPNPTGDFVSISSNKEISEASLFNVIGEQVLKLQSAFSKTLNINVSHLAAGVYTVVIETEEESIYRKIVVNR